MLRRSLLSLLTIWAFAGAAQAAGVVQVLSHRNAATSSSPPTSVGISTAQTGTSGVACLGTTYPTGVVAGNYAFFYMQANTNGGGPPASPPTGYTLVSASVDPGPGLTVSALYYRKLDGTETGTVCATIGSGVNNPVGVSLSTWSGLTQTGTPYESASTGANCCNTASGTTSNITSTSTNRLAVVFWGAENWGNNADRGSSPAAGWTNAGGDTWAVNGPGGGKTPIDTKVLATATTVTESRTATTSSAQTWGWASLALIPGP